MRLLNWISVIALAALAAWFAVSNRAVVTLALWPLPYGLEAPIFVLVYGAGMIGFTLGAALAWWSLRRWRAAGGRAAATLREREESG